ncbi:MAG: DUF2142 domain-containing protein [Acidimicrobiales bacterium]
MRCWCVFWCWWALSTAVLFALSLLWSLASPIPSGPDEPAQVVKAVAVAHGHLTGVDLPHAPGVVAVRVPATYAELSRPSQACVYRTPSTPGGCAPRLAGSSALVRTTTYVGDYPPLYYAFVGLPSLVSAAPWTLHAMRAMSALLNAGILGLGFAAARTWARSWITAVTLALSITPEAIYQASVINPNGLEITAAIVAWSSGAILVLDHYDEPPLGLVAVFVTASIFLCASRVLSPFWFALIIAAFVIFRSAQCRQLLRWRRIQIGLGISLFAAVISGIYILAEKSFQFESFPLPKGTTTTQILTTIIGKTYSYMVGAVGEYGKPDTNVPLIAVLVWGAGVGTLAVSVLLVARRRDAALFAFFAAGYLFVIPFAIIFSHAQTNGITWQGRYGYPIYVGVPILAGCLVAQRARVPARACYLAAGGVIIGYLIAFYWLLRRYMVGISPAYINLLAPVAHRWRPPLPVVILVAMTIGATILYGALIITTGRLRTRESKL